MVGKRTSLNQRLSQWLDLFLLHMCAREIAPSSCLRAGLDLNGDIGLQGYGVSHLDAARARKDIMNIRDERHKAYSTRGKLRKA